MILKLDPYINVDPGTMSAFQHREVFVTEDGAETDLDLGTMNSLPIHRLLAQHIFNNRGSQTINSLIRFKILRYSMFISILDF